MLVPASLKERDCWRCVCVPVLSPRHVTVPCSDGHPGQEEARQEEDAPRLEGQEGRERLRVRSSLQAELTEAQS